MEGDRIADLGSRSGSLISLYASRPSPGGFPALLSEALKVVRERSGSMSRPVQKSVRNDAERIHGLAGQLEMGSDPGYAIFASELDGIFLVESLGQPPPTIATIGPRPYMRPLRAAPRSVRSGILVADNTLARTFTAVEGIVEELKAPMGADIGNRSWGGFSG